MEKKEILVYNEYKVKSMYRKKKKIETKYVVIIFTLASIVFLGILMTMLKDNRKLTFPEKIIKDGGLLLERVLYAPVAWVQNTFLESKEKQQLLEKYKELEGNVEEIDRIKAYQKELEREINALKEQLDLEKTLDEHTSISATVINRNIGYWHNTITIDKGESSGITPDMPVIVKNGLIGKVIKTSYLHSTVKLLTAEDINNKVSVRMEVGDSYIYGLLTSYDTKKKVFIVEGIDTNREIPLDSFVTTTGLSDIFPSGILIGKVKNITTDSFGLAKTLEVESAVDFDNISFVTVLKRDIP